MRTPSPGFDRARLTRRGVLAAGMAIGLAGCTEDEDPAGRRGRRREAARRAREVDPDVALAAEALASQQSAVEALQAARRRHRRLRGPLAAVVATHEAHARLLADAVPEGISVPVAQPARAPRDPAQALAALVRQEQELSTTTKQQAFSAESGSFARLLGSMAAAAAQGVVLLQTSAGDLGGRRR